MAGSVTADEALRELARRELARRRQQAAPSPAAPPAAPEEGGGFLRTVDDAVRGIADVATFGFADEIAAKLGAMTGVGSAGGDYEANVAAERARDAEGGAARLAGQVGGALLVPGAAASTLRGAVGIGAAQGAAYGLGSGEGEVLDRLPSAGVGAVVGGAAGGAVRTVANALSARASRAAIPETEDIKKAAGAAYDAAENAGVIIAPQGVQRLSQEVTSDLAEFGYHPSLQPRVGVVLNELGRLSEQPVTLKGMDVTRRIAQSAAQSMDPSERAIGKRIIGRIDDFVENMGEADVLGGDVASATAALGEARGLWSRMRKSEMVADAVTKAERRAASTGSGGNVDNATRQNIRKILDSPKLSRGFTEAERAAAEQVVRGTPTQNAARLVGKLSPQGNGLMAALGVGGAAAAPSYAIPAMVAGAVSKQYADRATPANVRALSEIIRSGGKTAQEMTQEAIAGVGPKDLVEAIGRYRRGERVAAPTAAALAAVLAERVRN